ncbi:xylan 1,4-beta-xylosidase [Streptomyces huiliensis]|uniref:xylan 1,4-beta-xylosidase n=1 Tax=Streptomyces huiliensis TaxID=2876027 RepID=UPI001CC1624D|nr:xylan 1,4-beta-xylosidase [Streptomyces huiliensis]MBZ4322407.1 xylan 1,4-beta-xylosidase [Streptomyces huiliensis]
MGRHAGGPAAGGPASPKRGRWRTAALLATVACALALLLAALLADWHSRGGAPHDERADIGWGFTHTKNSADRGDDSARRTAARLLAAESLPQNQHIMGWGADNPEPRPGSYNFADLDRRVALMRRSGGTPVLTLCCAPDWMKGGGARTDWSQKSLEKAPDRDHYRDFALLAGVVAKRYPDVHHFIVWNELKGFYDESRKRWNYEGYTELYNLVYEEIRKQRDDVLIGGPYVVMDSNAPDAASNVSALQGPWGIVDQRAVDALQYWNRHKAGADFVVVDGSSYTRDGDRQLPDEFRATRKFADVTTWLRKTTGLPVWWAEWYVEPADARDERAGWTEEHRVAVQAAAMMNMAESGVSAAFYWNPEGTSGACPGCLWAPTELGGGGGRLPMMDLLSRFAREFPPGKVVRRPDVRGNGGVLALASRDAMVLVNTRDAGVRVRVEGREVELKGYEVRWVG